tara:strand:- start:522 stop:728 length:207 start_codon:yes stop_codon:yes gene_type:complete
MLQGMKIVQHEQTVKIGKNSYRVIANFVKNHVIIKKDGKTLFKFNTDGWNDYIGDIHGFIRFKISEAL